MVHKRKDLHTLTDEKFVVFQKLRNNLEYEFEENKFTKEDKKQTLKMLEEDLIGD